MIIVSEWITNTTKKERTSHLNLNEICIIRGGNSTNHRGVLAEFLCTDIPAGNKVNLCHACGNDRCSNPKHLYWGTPKENTEDAFNHGTHPWCSFVGRVGNKAAHQHMRNISQPSKAGRIGGSKMKSPEHRKNISIAIKESWRKRKCGAGDSNP